MLGFPPRAPTWRAGRTAALAAPVSPQEVRDADAVVGVALFLEVLLQRLLPTKESKVGVREA